MTDTPKKTATSIQIGGTHYSGMKIQPSYFIASNELNWYEGNAIKYLCRHKLKGQAQDIKKSIHYCLLLLEHEYGITAQIQFRDDKVNESPF